MLLKENGVPIVKWACFLTGKFLQFLETPHQMLFFLAQVLQRRSMQQKSWKTVQKQKVRCKETQLISFFYCNSI